MPSSSGMNPIADRATSRRRSSKALAGNAGAAVEGGLVLEDLGVVLEHQLVEDDELGDPKQTEGADVGGGDDQRLHGVVVLLDVVADEVHGDGGHQQAEEGQGPEGDDLLPQMRASPL